MAPAPCPKPAMAISSCLSCWTQILALGPVSHLIRAKTACFLFESLESAALIHTHSRKLEMKAVYFVNGSEASLWQQLAGARGEGGGESPRNQVLLEIKGDS